MQDGKGSYITAIAHRFCRFNFQKFAYQASNAPDQCLCQPDAQPAETNVIASVCRQASVCRHSSDGGQFDNKYYFHLQATFP